MLSKWQDNRKTWHFDATAQREQGYYVVTAFDLNIFTALYENKNVYKSFKKPKTLINVQNNQFWHYNHSASFKQQERWQLT